MAFDYRLARALVLAWIVIAPICAAAAGPNYTPIATARVQAGRNNRYSHGLGNSSAWRFSVVQQR